MSYNQRNRIFKIFYRRYFNKVRLRVMRILYNEKDAADDIAQEAFMRAYMYLDRIYKKDEFLKWVYTVSRNLSYNYRRDKRYDINSSLDAKITGYENNITLLDKTADTSNPAPDEMAQKNEFLHMFKYALKRLSPNYRVALQLCGIDGLTYIEAAQTLNTSVSVIAHNLMRAKRELSCLIG
ncbi:MAG: RNA polymerase sigma factor [Dehalococcoidia bacterium]|nr:MAG: RNA polymerase sigma factor [Dehalococcoidia bacterium]